MVSRLISAFDQIDIIAAPLDVARMSHVATRGQVCNGLTPANVQGQSASYHVMHDNVSAMTFKFANWRVNTSGQEVGPGAAATIEFFLEYPLFSAPQRVQFSGNNVGNITDGGDLDVTVAGDFRRGIPFRVLTYRTCSAGVVYHSGGAAHHLGEKGQLAASVSNTISTGAIGGSDYTNYYAPLEITGMTKRRTFTVLDDSIGDGYSTGQGGEVSNTFWGDRGVIAKSLGRHFAYNMLSVAGDQAQWFVANHSKRLESALKASDVWIGYGRNDLGSGARTGAQVNADTATIAGYFPSSTKLYTRTLLPWATSSDNFATNANQTVTAAANHLNTVNVERMKRTSPFIYCADLYTICSDRNGPFTPKWKTDPSQALAKFFTTDGDHPNERCNDHIVASGLVRLAA